MKTNIPSFSKYLKEEDSTVYFTFGRMNPPTAGHEKLLDALAEKSHGNPYKVFLSHSQDATKNPLSFNEKVKHVRKIFPRHARAVKVNEQARDVLMTATILFNEGYKNIVMVVGEDRRLEFEILLEKYNGVDERHGFYNFKSIKVESAGMRDPDSAHVSGVSASKQRQFVAENNFVQFSHGIPEHVSNNDTKKLFNDVRRGMGLPEEFTFKNHIQMKPVSETREEYVAGSLFELGDRVRIIETNQEGEVTVLGANYLIVEFENGDFKRTWLDGVEKLEDQAKPKKRIDEKTKVLWKNIRTQRKQRRS